VLLWLSFVSFCEILEIELVSISECICCYIYLFMREEVLVELVF